MCSYLGSLDYGLEILESLLMCQLKDTKVGY